MEHKKKTPSSYISKKLKLKTPNRNDFHCVLCGSDQTKTVLEIDHILPKMSGGTNESSNLHTLCHECNCGKALSRHERRSGTLLSKAV